MKIPNKFPALPVVPKMAGSCKPGPAKMANPAKTAGPAKPPKRPMAVLAKQEAGSQEARPGPAKLSKGLVKLLDFI